MINKKIASEVAVGIVLLVALAVGGIFWMENRNTVISNQSSVIESPQKQNQITEEKKEGVVCTQEAKLCEDGSYVSRTRDNCEFAECPTALSSKKDSKEPEVTFKEENLEGDAVGGKIIILRKGVEIASLHVDYLIGNAISVVQTGEGLYFTWTPDGLGGYYIFGNVYTDLYYLDFLSNKISKAEDPGNYLTSYIASSDNKYIAFHDEKNIIVRNLEAKSDTLYDLPIKPKDGQNFQIGDLYFSPNSDKLSVSVGYGPENEHGSLYVLNLNDKVYTLYKSMPKGIEHILGWKNENEIEFEKDQNTF